jgi:hypothetical protein
MDTADPTDRTPRHDGWTDERRARFLDSLAARGNVRLACRRVHLSPEAAYRLKRRDPGFARAWEAALVLAYDCGLDTLADRAIDGVEEAVWHHGEQVGTRRKYDSRLLLAHLARLAKASENKAARADAARFDELVACVTGEPAWDDLLDQDDDALLPLDRERASVRAGIWAEELASPTATGEDEADPEAEAGEPEDAIRAYRDGRAAGEALWDSWYDHACCYVDWLTGWDEPPPLPGLPGNPLPEPLARALAEVADRPCESPLKSFARTLSESSTSAMACALAGSLAPSVAVPRSPRAARRRAAR